MVGILHRPLLQSWPRCRPALVADYHVDVLQTLRLLETPVFTQCHGDTFYLCKRHYSAASLSSLCYIETLVRTSLSTHLNATVTIADEATSNSNHSSNSEYCTNIGGITLTRKHLHQIINGKELCNLHVNAFQNLLKLQFPCIGGLQNTLAETGPAQA